MPKNNEAVTEKYVFYLSKMLIKFLVNFNLLVFIVLFLLIINEKFMCFSTEFFKKVH